MERFDFSWGSGGSEVFAVDWRPRKGEKAVIALVHGLGEHVGRYEHVAAAFGAAGYATVGMDLPGHGRSAGKRGHASFARIRDEIDRLLGEARARHAGLPLFLYGHSLGGLLVLTYCFDRKPDIRGAVVTSPGLRTAEPVAAWKLLLAKTVGALAPSITMPNGLPHGMISRDPEVVRRYDADPLVHSMISARLGLDLLTAGPRLIADAAALPVPLLFLQGSADGIVDPAAASEFAAAAGSKATLKIFDGLYHELHNEPEKAEVFRFVVERLDAWLGR